MNARIIETPHGPLLLLRDMDEDQNPILVLKVYGDDLIVTQSFTCESPEKVQELIASTSLETATSIAKTMVALFDGPPTSFHQ